MYVFLDWGFGSWVFLLFLGFVFSFFVVGSWCWGLASSVWRFGHWSLAFGMILARLQGNGGGVPTKSPKIT